MLPTQLLVCSLLGSFISLPNPLPQSIPTSLPSTPTPPPISTMLFLNLSIFPLSTFSFWVAFTTAHDSQGSISSLNGSSRPTGCATSKSTRPKLKLFPTIPCPQITQFWVPKPGYWLLSGHHHETETHQLSQASLAAASSSSSGASKSSGSSSLTISFICASLSFCSLQEL